MKKGILLDADPSLKRYRQGWRGRLKCILLKHNHIKKNLKGHASYKSQELRAKRLYACFEILRKKLGYGIEDPKNLKPRHIEALVKYWVEKGLAPSSIDNYLSILRLFCIWIIKDGMVRRMEDYAPGLKRTYAAEKDRSWSGTVDNPWKLWDKVYTMDKNVGMQLLLAMAFGARNKEMLCFKPFLHAREHIIILEDGVKGDRIRDVDIDSDFKRAVIEVLKAHIKNRKGKPNEWIGHPKKTLEQNKSRFYYVLGKCGITKAKLGITGHGLRVEFVMDELEKHGLVSTLRGGTASLPDRDKFKETLYYLRVSEKLGHSRKSVIAAYFGPLRPRRDPKDGEDDDEAPDAES